MLNNGLLHIGAFSIPFTVTMVVLKNTYMLMYDLLYQGLNTVILLYTVYVNTGAMYPIRLVLVGIFYRSQWVEFDDHSVPRKGHHTKDPTTKI